MSRIILFLLLTPLFVNAQWEGTNPVYFNAGNVGIGTSNPLSKVQVEGSIWSNATRTNTVFSGVSSQQNANLIGTAGYWAFRTNTSNAFNLDVYNSGSPIVALTTLQNGNIGIGTTNPLYKLQVNSNQSSNFRLVSNGSTTPNPTIDIYDSVNGTEFVLSPSVGKVDLFTYSNHSLALGTANIERMRIDNNGNVGVGTANPLGKVSIIGSLWANATRTNTVFSGNIESNNANFIGSEGYWALRTATNNSFNLDVYNSASPIVAMSVIQNGNVGIGTTAPDAKLAVKGTIHTQEVRVDLNGAVAPDYVFNDDYKLLSLAEIKTYIDKNKHLPEVPSAKEMEANGVNLGEMNMLLLKKIEELTLHLIEQQKQNENQQREIEILKYRIKQ